MNSFVILCGGFGKRFQKVSSTLPKILIPVHKKISMLDWLLDIYLPQNSKVILATGYLNKKICEYVANRKYSHELVIVEEKNPLGTGGALINASRFVDSHDFIALNGDTIQDLKIDYFLKNSELKNDTKINVGCTIKKKNDSGMLLIDEKNLIQSFTEKRIPKTTNNKRSKLVTSLGIYRCDTSFFRNEKVIRLSLEEDLLPKLVKLKQAEASVFTENFQDFGTYERYKQLINKNIELT